MSSNRTKLKYAHLHAVTFVPGLGNLKQQFELKTNESNPSASQLVQSIELIDDTLVEIKSKHPKTGDTVTFLSPVTNFNILLPLEG